MKVTIVTVGSMMAFMSVASAAPYETALYRDWKGTNGASIRAVLVDVSQDEQSAEFVRPNGIRFMTQVGSLVPEDQARIRRWPRRAEGTLDLAISGTARNEARGTSDASSGDGGGFPRATPEARAALNRSGIDSDRLQGVLEAYSDRLGKLEKTTKLSGLPPFTPAEREGIRASGMDPDVLFRNLNAATIERKAKHTASRGLPVERNEAIPSSGVPKAVIEAVSFWSLVGLCAAIYGIARWFVAVRRRRTSARRPSQDDAA